MNRLLVLGGSLVAAAAVAALPAVIGLSGNPSFSHQLPVHVPSQARAVELVDGSSEVSVAPAPSATRSRAEAADDRPSDGGPSDGGPPGDGPAPTAADPVPTRSRGSRDDGPTAARSTGTGREEHPSTVARTSEGGDSRGGPGPASGTTSHDAPTGGSTSDRRHGGDATNHA
ncbi:MAG TPA: hypothetical protein VGN18_17170 [Jatrophihabitans sp.]|uniref:hypothetical protein n=1 Tax=Jatrophihabitans sp. TaxID=1932789 RepID=UPI002DFE929A|nr:hypothetical protein [Jatrophihabitans sp.]